MLKVENKYLDIDFYPNFLSTKESKKLYSLIEENVSYRGNFNPDKRRVNQIYGDKGLVYEINFRGNISKRYAIEWDELPILEKIKNKIEDITGDYYNFCVIQRYPNGTVGINPHKDKEMTKGTRICGLSLGETRILNMGAPKFLDEQDEKIMLNNGSLYIFNPPTNDYWTHCIEEDETENPRISLTFRNYTK
jgi:alkylated DNA repair dioxygenase AlkB